MDSIFIPRTSLGEKLLDLRNRAIAKGLKLLTENEVLELVNRRRGEDRKEGIMEQRWSWIIVLLSLVSLLGCASQIEWSIYL
jgi:hypothetical protein